MFWILQPQVIRYAQGVKANVLFFYKKQASENLPVLDVLARDIAENLGSALGQFSTIYRELEEE